MGPEKRLLWHWGEMRWETFDVLTVLVQRFGLTPSWSRRLSRRQFWVGVVQYPAMLSYFHLLGTASMASLAVLVAAKSFCHLFLSLFFWSCIGLHLFLSRPFGDRRAGETLPSPFRRPRPLNVDRARIMANTSAHTRSVHVLPCFNVVHRAVIVLYVSETVDTFFQTLVVCLWLEPVIVIVVGIVMGVFVFWFVLVSRVVVLHLFAKVDVFRSFVSFAWNRVLAKDEEP